MNHEQVETEWIIRSDCSHQLILDGHDVTVLTAQKLNEHHHTAVRLMIKVPGMTRQTIQTD